MFKKLAIALTLILLVFGTALGITAGTQQKAKETQLASDKKQIAALQKEQSELESELNNLKTATGGSRSDNQTGLVLCFTAAGKDFMSTVYPQMEKAGYTGLIALRNNIIPGDSDTITAGELQGLISEGWNCVVGTWYMVDFNNDEKTVTAYFQNYMKEYVSNLREWAKITPTAVYFDENTYQPYLDDSIEQMGFDTVYYEGDAVKSSNDALTLIHVVNYEQGQDAVQTEKNTRTLGLRVTVDWVDNTPDAARYSKQSFADCLSSLNAAEQNRTIQMLGSDLTPSRTISSKDKRDAAKIEERLKEIEEELDALYQ